jgi:hypothetical protein
MRPFRLVCVTALLLSAGHASIASPQTQSLADVAKKEEDRRKANPQPAKVYTNKDLTPAPAGSPPVPAASQSKEEKDASKGKAADPKDGKGADGKDGTAADGKDGPKDQKYWNEKMKALRDQLDRDKTFADALQNKINSLTTDFVNRDDPAQKRVIEQDRQKALAELSRLAKQIADDQKAIAGLEEDARRAGVPAGWLR